MAERALATAAMTASLLLDRKGRLPSFELFDCTIRGALLVDLARTGRIVQLGDRIEVDASASGVRAVDVLVGELGAGQQTIDQQIRDGEVSLMDVGRHLVEDGRWSWRGPLHRRFQVVDPSLLHLRRLSARGVQRADPAVARLLEVSGVTLDPPKASWRTPDRAGEVEWLVETVVEVLRDVRAQLEARTRVLKLNAAGSPPVSPFP